ncbi:hypothetical protein FGIG_06179 [Fasciola gigantica]|uniref:Uncharacterized protein n=1 Tax=Fasciola gigantica TaxID=46835 RepID=A0A504YCQ7_FASGI|nr:hypothetical protein FGIG_06179 [Fasciola gigantica]
MQLIRRQIDTEAFEDQNNLWLSCSLLVGSTHVLDLVTVRWEGGLFETAINQTELNTIYSQSVLRNSSENSITARLRLNIPVAPIIRLAYDPPPIPPANFSHRFICKDPPCTAELDKSNASDSTVANWTGACELVAAYPPVSESGIIWAWSEPQWASYAIHRVNEVGKATYLSEISSTEMFAEKELSIPWRVLERKKRKRDVKNAEDLHLETGGDRPSVPVIFWCWTKNSVGQTAVWWPGPVAPSSGFWASIWWPVLGVALELISLCIVFGFFRYCHRKRQLRAYVHAPGDEQVSFGLSRLLDTEDSPSNMVPQQSSGVSSAAEIKRIGLMQSVPYVRLSEVTSHSDVTDEKPLGHIGPGFVEHRDDTPASKLAPAEHDPKTPNASTQETDEYFWDLDGAPVNSERKQ